MANSDDSLKLKIVFWIVAIFVIGTLACVILGTLKVAIQTMLILAGIFLIIALGGMVVYQKIKNRIDLGRD